MLMLSSGPKKDFIMTILKNIGNEYFFSFVSQRHDFRTKCLIWESVTFNFNKVWIKTITHIYFAVMRLLPINKSVSQFRKQTDQKTQNINISWLKSNSLQSSETLLIRAHVHEDFCDISTGNRTKITATATVNNNKKYAQIINSESVLIFPSTRTLMAVHVPYKWVIWNDCV